MGRYLIALTKDMKLAIAFTEVPKCEPAFAFYPKGKTIPEMEYRDLWRPWWGGWKHLPIARERSDDGSTPHPTRRPALERATHQCADLHRGFGGGHGDQRVASGHAHWCVDGVITDLDEHCRASPRAGVVKN
jgi:hypothetical protein